MSSSWNCSGVGLAARIRRSLPAPPVMRAEKRLRPAEAINKAHADPPVGAQLSDVVRDVAEHEGEVTGVHGAQAARAQGGAHVAQQLPLVHACLPDDPGNRRKLGHAAVHAQGWETLKVMLRHGMTQC